jgi:rhodanese-related sulfurtransferase
MQLTRSIVTKIAPAGSDVARAHFAAKLTFETDCWDVHHALDQSVSHGADFVLVDVRCRDLFAEGHIAGALGIPWRELTAERLADHAPDTVFVVYCAGPHCNGSTNAALRLAELGRPVKEMIGGITGWLDEGYELVQ